MISWSHLSLILYHTCQLHNREVKYNRIGCILRIFSTLTSLQHRRMSDNFISRGLSLFKVIRGTLTYII